MGTTKQKSGFLLTGQAISNAESWLTEGQIKKPPPSHIHKEYIQTSRKIAIRQRRRLMLASLSASIMIVIALIAAVIQSGIARENEQLANQEAEVSRGLEGVQNSAAEFARNTTDVSLVLAYNSIDVTNPPAEILRGASEIIMGAFPSRTYNYIPQNILDVSLSPDGQLLAFIVSHTYQVRESTVTMYVLSTMTGDVLMEEELLRTNDYIGDSSSINNLYLDFHQNNRVVLVSESGNRSWSGEAWEEDLNAPPTNFLYQSNRGVLEGGVLSVDGETLSLYGMNPNPVHDLPANQPMDHAISEDNRWIAVGFGSPVFGYGGSVRVWDTWTEGQIAQGAVLSTGSGSRSMSHDGKYFVMGQGSFVTIASPQEDTEVLVWRTEADITSLQFHPEDNRFAIGMSNGRIGIYQVEQESPITVLDGDGGGVVAVGITNDERVVATSWDGQTVRLSLWDINSGDVLQVHEISLESVFGDTPTFGAENVFLSPSADLVVLAHPRIGMGFSIWRLSDGQIADFDKETPGSYFVMDAIVSANSQTVVSQEVDINLRGEIGLQVWNANTLERLGILGQENVMSISDDGNLIVTKSENNQSSELRVWSLQQMDVVREIPIDAIYAGFTRDGELVVQDEGGQLRIYIVPTTVEDLRTWAMSNRSIRGLTCDEREQFDVLPLCTD
jgi:WD40 repeat protein